MIEYIVDNRVALAYMYATVILGMTYANMSAPAWKGKIIKYSVGVFVLLCVMNASQFVLGLL